MKIINITQTTWIGSAIATIMAYIAPMAEIFIVIMTFVVFDLISGVMASRKNNIPCNSKKLRQSIVKLISYISVILLIYATENAFDLQWINFYKFIGGFICFVELISILENMAIITEKSIFLKIVEIIRGKAKDKYGEIIDEIKNEKTQ